MNTLNDWTNQLHEEAKRKGWHSFGEDDKQFVERMCNNLHDEISELHEAYRNGTLYEPCDKAETMKRTGLPALTCLEEEMADIFIRLCDNAGRLKVDLQKAVEIKRAFNLTRPYRHGNKLS